MSLHSKVTFEDMEAKRFKMSGELERNIMLFDADHRYGGSAQKWGVTKPRDAKPKKRLLHVGGTGRCGTMFLAHALKAAGISTGHEYCGIHEATVSHFFHVDANWHPMFPWHTYKAHIGERRSDYEFEHEVHLVRSPLSCIPSIRAIFPRIDYAFLEDVHLLAPGTCNKPPLVRAMWAWYAINRRMLEVTDIVVRIENIYNDWSENCRYLPELPRMPPKNKASGFRKTQPLKVGDMMAIEPALTRDILKLARRLGYDL